ncbi:hypothetical protein PAPYR_11455 [Paratrimastix pyriformis]|uniref:Uncharacterized protein n=1 Tax=Paratrimastix pyriformis TaxID=342808 RepID=A0ABQ8U693_9EUKA|nr:hypothetical protein PAPYR_11455 [Paratrimastix pyriformis]
MSELFIRCAKDVETDKNSLQARTANNPSWNDISTQFSALKVQTPVFNNRCDTASASTALFGASALVYNMQTSTGLISTRDDAVRLTLSAGTYGSAVPGTAYVPGFPLLLLRRIQFTCSGQTLSDLTPYGMYMLGCLSDPGQRAMLFRMWHIDDAVADRHAAITANVTCHIPLYSVAPFNKTENFLRAKSMTANRGTYTIDLDTAGRITDLSGATVTSAPSLTSMAIVSNHPAMDSDELRRLELSPSPTMYLDCYNSADATIPAGSSNFTYPMALNSNITGFMFMVVNEAAENTAYDPFTPASRAAVTNFYLNIDSSNVPNINSDSTEYSQMIFQNSLIEWGYGVIPDRVYGYMVPYQETPEHDINLGILHQSAVRAPQLVITLANTVANARHLHIVYFTKRLGRVDAHNDFVLEPMK